MSGRRDGLLREMGLAPLWRLRSEAGAETAPEAEGDTAAAVQFAAATVEAPIVPNPPPAAPGMARPVPGPAAVSPAPAPARETPSGPAADADRAERIALLDWDALERDIRACTTCRLCERRRQAVPGVGDRQADWMFVGEGPGAEEDLRGEPFVGAAGQLLDAMLASVGLKRGEGVYIANAVKCRPPHNRTPEADEIDACAPYLARQIALVRPRLLVALGRPAARALLKDDVAIGAARGRVFDYERIPVVVTYHPAYLLRNQRDKAKVWEDLCFARRLMGTLKQG